MTTHVLFLTGFLTLPLFGAWTWRLDAVRGMDRRARVAVAGAAGAVVVAFVMALLSLLHVRWSRTTLFVVFGIIAIASIRQAIRGRQSTAERSPRPPIGMTIGDVLLIVLVLLTGYGLLTARESSGDLLFFWGPKAIGFYRAGGIDAAFLGNPIHPNSDYPPLLPLLYAWSHTVARQFSWWAALLTTLLSLLGCAAIVRAFSEDKESTLLVAATLAYTFAVGFAAGGADPPLVFFETLALAAVTFIDHRRSADILTAIGLAGAAWTKIEGAAFVVAVVLAIMIVQRNMKRAIVVAMPAAILLGGWLIFLIRNDLLFGYGGAKMRVYLDVLPTTLLLMARSATYELLALPWIVPIVLLAMGRMRRATLPLLVAVLTIVAAIFFYIHLPDPGWWIAASAPRVLLTPLMALIIAAIAANRPTPELS